MLDPLLSLLGPAYFGYKASSYVAVVVWALLSAAFFFWRNRDALKQAKRHAYGTETVPASYLSFVTLLLFIAVAVLFLAAHFGVYFLVRAVSS